MAPRLALCTHPHAHQGALKQWGARLWRASQALPAGWQADVQAAEALVLLADTAQNCALAVQARALNPDLLIVAGMTHARVAEHTALLRSGADWILRAGDGPELLITTLDLLLARRQGAAGRMPSPAGWRLSADGWWLHHGSQRLRLSVAERALVQVLLAAPGQVATEASLVAALQQAGHQARVRLTSAPSVRHQFSRLRQRARHAGLGMVPIESLSGYGYVWH